MSLILLPRPIHSTLFPYTTLFRSPLRPSTFVAADLTVNFAIGMTGMLGALAVGWLVFGVTPSGNLVLELLRSEEHTSELQSRGHLVCRLLLEKKKVI